MKIIKLVVSLLTVLLITACTSEPSDDLQDSIVETTAVSNFDPANSVIPFPNDLLFASSADATLNIPVADANDLSDPQVALNGVDGFSTIAPFSTGFTGPILESSLNGNSVRVYDVSLSSSPAPGGAVVGINSTLVYGIDYVATVSSVDKSRSTLAIVPLRPLNPRSHYYVVITNELKSSDGNAMGASGAYIFTKINTPLEVGGVSQYPSLTDAQAVALEPLRALASTSEATLMGFDTSIGFNDVIMSWSFTTQSIGNVLTQVRTDIRNAGAPATTIVDSGQTSPGGLADIYVGTLEVPYYLTAAAHVNDPTPLGSFWQGLAGSNLSWLNTSPVATSTQTIPVMMSVPLGAGAGTPVVIYQHGLITSRVTLLAVADSLAAAGLAAIAIDLPLHGRIPGEAFYSGSERTFDLDLVTQNADGDIIAAAPDGVTDSTGSHYINLSNLQNSRDNLRQSVSDLFTLTWALLNNSFNAGGFTLASSRIYFLGHSTGGFAGITAASIETDIRDVVIASAGGGIPKILDGSFNFSPAVVAGLAANGVDKGTPDYESFLGAAQTVVDSADPINYATALAAIGQGILFYEIVGGNSSPSDLTVPNRVPDGNDSSGTVPAPLAGTEPMLALMGLRQVNASEIFGDAQFSIKLVAGDHSSMLDPGPSLAVTTEIQTGAAAFFATDGASFVATDPNLLLAP